MSKNNNNLNQLVGKLLNDKPSKRNNNKRPKKSKPSTRARGLARNPGSRRGTDSMLSLTRDQFTATSPLNLFTIKAGSTPGGVRVSGRELISAVNVPIATGVFALSTTFSGAVSTASAITPVVFPRLSAYAPIYEYFVFHKLSYLFQSNQPTTQAGEIILAVDYDPTDAVPTTTAGMMRNISSTMSNIYSDASLQVLKSLSRLPKFECSLGVPTEILQQCQGVLTVAVEGYSAAAPSTVGYIIAQYDVEFFTPQ